MQSFNEVKQPMQPGYQEQVELEEWCNLVGASRALRDGWQKGAANNLTDRIVGLYLEKVREIYQKSKDSPGRQAHIWDLMHSEKAVDHVAVESLCYVMTHIDTEQKYTTLAMTLGQRAEYVLWLTHPSWGKSLHLKGLKLASNNDMGMGKIIKRLRDKGFRKAAYYKQLKCVERVALGGFFIECIAEATKMIEIYMVKSIRSQQRYVRASMVYWEFQCRWKEALKLHRTIRLPMIAMPRPWTKVDDGGYYTQRTELSTVGWERWPEVSKQALPCVVDAVNHLQTIPHCLDDGQMEFERALWQAGHALGKLPSMNRLSEPIDHEYKIKGLGPRAYWEAVWRWKSDQRKNSSRVGFVHAQIIYEKLQNQRSLHWVWYMDSRGRCYCRGGQVNPQGPDHMRSLIRFTERSPMKGNEDSFAWSLGEAYGLQADMEVRRNYLVKMSHVLGRIGANPMGLLPYLEKTKEPFRFVQLCRDWHGYLNDPGYTTGTIHWVDQTCSGWGHVACLTSDGVLALFTNVIGTKKGDLYAGLGKLVISRLRWIAENEDHPDNERRARFAAWWLKHDPPRSFWKKALMPVIYGQTHMAMCDTIAMYLRDEVKDFLADEGLRIVELASVMASIMLEVTKEALPNYLGLSRWLAAAAGLMMDKGIRPYWFTPNGLAVESYSETGTRDQMELTLAGRAIHLSHTEGTPGQFNRKRTARRLVPDFVHSHDAAFMQRFVAHWKTYQRPISTVHDCFGTTLGSVETMRKELNDQWARFYSVDYLARHKAMVETLVQEPVPEPPMLNTLERSRLGENPFLFC
jgi:DNA-directed RNA polymerase